MTSVPCGSCRACCRDNRIVLSESDDPAAYRWHVEGIHRVLDKTESLDCVYLVETGCSIHDSAPKICREFDCRELAASTPPEWQRLHIRRRPAMAEVYAAGKARL